MLLTGVFASDVGLIYGEWNTFMYHLLTLAIVTVFCFGGSYLLYMIVDRIIPIRVRVDQEAVGLDLSQHGEKID